MFKNNIRFFLRQTLTIGMGVGDTFLISNDFEGDNVIDTNGEIVSISIVNQSQIERLEVTIAGNIAAIVKRGITQSQDLTTDASLQKQWLEGSIGFITAFASDLIDGKEDIVLSDGQRVSLGSLGYIVTYNDGVDIVFKDDNNAERTLQDLSSSGSNDQVRASTLDTTPGALNQKLIVGEGLDIDITNPSGAEALQLSVIQEEIGIPGEIKMWCTDTVPSSWLICDGSAVGRSANIGLFSVIGESYGAGDGATTFNVPDLRGRVPVGLDSSQTEFNTLNNSGGDKQHTLTESEMPEHVHEQPGYVGVSSSGASNGVGGDNESFRRQTSTGEAGGGQPHNNLQPYLVVNYIIKT